MLKLSQSFPTGISSSWLRPSNILWLIFYFWHSKILHAHAHILPALGLLSAISQKNPISSQREIVFRHQIWALGMFTATGCHCVQTPSIERAFRKDLLSKNNEFILIWSFSLFWWITAPKSWIYSCLCILCYACCEPSYLYVCTGYWKMLQFYLFLFQTSFLISLVPENISMTILCAAFFLPLFLPPFTSRQGLDTSKTPSAISERHYILGC